MVTKNTKQKQNKSKGVRKWVAELLGKRAFPECFVFLFLLLWLFLYFLYYKYFSDLPDLFLSCSQKCLGDNITDSIVNNFNFIKNKDIRSIGIQIMIGLLSVIAVAALSYFTFVSNLLGKKSSKKDIKRNEEKMRHARTYIIRLLRIIIFFIFIFLFLGFSKNEFTNLFVFASLSVILLLTAYYLGRIFERISLKEVLGPPQKHVPPKKRASK